jgi:hypothetical protein
MNCRQFRKLHVAFVDDLLSASDMDCMQQHVAICVDCSKRDVSVRRSLMIVRNLPTIEPSPDFMFKLNERLRTSTIHAPSERRQHVSARSFAAVAAGIIAVAALTYSFGARSRQNLMVPKAQVASAMQLRLEPDLSPMSDAAVLATVPTGIPVWSAMFTVGQLPTHFANVEIVEAMGR